MLTKFEQNATTQVCHCYLVCCTTTLDERQDKAVTPLRPALLNAACSMAAELGLHQPSDSAIGLAYSLD